MPLYDFLAPAYDLAFEKIYRPFRERAFEQHALAPGACVLDLACGTGQNFPHMAQLLGKHGHVVGLDVSRGMLRLAQRRAKTDHPDLNVTLIHAPAGELTREMLVTQAQIESVDAVFCTFGFTSMREPEPAFAASWNLLKPGGLYLILDIHAAPRTGHARLVELATRSRFGERAWRPLEAASPDFRMDYLDPSAHLFGGRVFVARGTKPPIRAARHVPHHQQGR